MTCLVRGIACSGVYASGCSADGPFYVCRASSPFRESFSSCIYVPQAPAPTPSPTPLPTQAPTPAPTPEPPTPVPTPATPTPAPTPFTKFVSGHPKGVLVSHGMSADQNPDVMPLE